MTTPHSHHPKLSSTHAMSAKSVLLMAGLALCLYGAVAPKRVNAQAAAKPSAHEHGAHDNKDGHHSANASAAIGVPGQAAKVTRTIEISMSDSMRFTPDAIAVKRGETVRFIVKNTGQLKHEFNLGTAAELKKHYALMLKFPEMEHDDPNVASVEPGKTGEVVWQFSKAGTVSFACLHPGHFEAGMKGSIKVSGL